LSAQKMTAFKESVTHETSHGRGPLPDNGTEGRLRHLVGRCHGSQSVVFLMSQFEYKRGRIKIGANISIWSSSRR